MLAWLRRLLGTRELAADSPVRHQRELTTEARLRVAQSRRMIDRIERGEMLLLPRPPERRKDEPT